LSESVFQTTLQQLRKDLSASGHDLSWSLNPPASEDDLIACEVAVGNALPGDFRAFLKVTNGCSITVDPEPHLSADLDILGTDGIIEKFRRVGAAFRDLSADRQADELMGLPPRPVIPETSWIRLIPFAHYGVGDCLFYLQLDPPSRQCVVDMDHEVIDEVFDNVIAGTFQEWLSNIVESIRSRRNVVYWLPSDP
jgi:cell wall assembly regulator SMI1